MTSEKQIMQITKKKIAREQAYHEMKDWAKREIANSVMNEGFRGLDGVLMMIFQAYRNWEQEHPYIKDER